MRSRNLLDQLRRWRRAFHTVRHLQPRQAGYFFWRRGIGPRRVAPSTGALACRDIALHPALRLEHEAGDFADYEFNFLNHPLSFARDAMDWCPRDAQRLWRYNLHYFDFLRDTARPLQQKIALIDDWIAHNPQGSEPAWEAYTASLRIVNWCLFFWSLPRAQIKPSWLESLHTQARWLEKNLELHILANHYFENVKAMLFAALFFADRDSARRLTHFQHELIAQLREQTLPDGGHYERSPQYHCILLEDCLDIYALLRENAALLRPETLTLLAQTIDAGLRFLAAIATPDDGIPLFNDSADGAANRPSAIFAKARALGFAVEVPQTVLIDFPHSGLFGWKCGGDYFLIDCGDIGPAYQPGHTHCDFLSFVLMIDRQWIAVDSGVCEYEPGPMRSYVRSTAAHNTVVVDDSEQSEIWGEFRVARRARSLGASIRRGDQAIVFEGAYRGFPALNAAIVHRRRALLTLDAAGSITALAIDDTVMGGGSAQPHRVQSLLHLHPTLHIAPTGTAARTLAIQRDDRLVASLHSELDITASAAPGWFCPEFGRRLANPALQLQTQSALPAQLSYRLTLRHSN